MNRLKLLGAAATVALAMGFVGAAQADDTADNIIVTNPGDGNTNSNDEFNVNDANPVPTNAVDDNLVSFYSVGDLGSVTIKFTDNLAYDGVGADIRIWERCGDNLPVSNANEEIDASVALGASLPYLAVEDMSSDGSSSVEVFWGGLNPGDRRICPIDIDLSGSGFLYADTVNITDTGTGTNVTYGGIDVAEVEALNSIAPADVEGTITKDELFGNDPVIVSDTATQQYSYVITIDTTNEDAYPLDPATLVWRDTAPAEFDMDLDAEDARDEFTPNCAGIGEDGSCDGLQVINGTCEAVATRTSGSTKGKPDSKKHPEHITITFTTREICEVQVWTTTAENPASKKGKKGPNHIDEQYSPTSCDGEFVINDGVSVHDAATGTRLFGPFGSLSVACPE